MRNIYIYIYLILVSFIGSDLYSQNILFVDTLQSKKDTILCSSIGASLVIFSQYDTLQYKIEWQDTFGLKTISNSFTISNSGRLIVTSTPFDTSQVLYIDTLDIKVHFLPDLKVSIDSVRCYNGDSITIKDLSTTYGTYTKAYFSDINGTFNLVQNMLLKYLVENGDTITRYVKYQTDGCPDKLDTFQISTKFTPVIQLQSDQVCYGDSTTIYNQSLFNPLKSNTNIQLPSYGLNFNTSNDFKIYISKNGGNEKLYVQIDQEGCSSRDSIIIFNKLRPDASFEPNKTCENEFLSFKNKSSDIVSNVSYLLKINNSNVNHQNLILSDTLRDGTFNYSFIIDNKNGCLDTFSGSLKIDSVTYINFSGLNKVYCEKQDTVILTGSERGGDFSGLFVTDLKQGKAHFKPEYSSSKVPVQYKYTNALGCTDVVIKVVDTIYSKPQLSVTGIDAEYCEKDPPSTFRLNQSIELNSFYKIYLNNNLLDQKIGLEYNFNPLVPGRYSINNFYTDQNGCFNEITLQTVVNPLPKIQLDSIITIVAGTSIFVGNLLGTERDVQYNWSNGDVNSSTRLHLPGIYTLDAINKITGCNIQDTIEIRFDTTKDDRIDIVKVTPNPSSNFIDINTVVQVFGIELISLTGLKQSINGVNRWNTDQNGRLVLDLSSLQNGFYCLLIPEIGRLLVLKT